MTDRIPSPWVSAHDTKPTVAGWYAVALYWGDLEEGMTPYAAHWNGSTWSESPFVDCIVEFIDLAQLTEDQARDLAYRHDEGF